MSDDRSPTYEQLAAVVIAQAETIAELRGEVARLDARVAELERQLRQNSRNSSKPPSADSPFDKPSPKSLRRKSGRKPGGQPGHPGSTLALVADPDEVRRHEPAMCAGCGGGLSGAEQVRVERRQVFDLPPMTIRVTEHQLVTRRCACGCASTAPAPDGVSARAQYGPRMAAIIVYLYVGQFLSRARTAQALAELFDTPVSAATVAAATERAADGLDGFLGRLRERLTTAPVVGFDETGFRVEAKLHWVHCARTDKYTLLTCHPKRGVLGIDHAGVLPGFCGVAVHDAWAPYDTYVDAAHQLCCAHLARELAGVAETVPDADWCWATQAADALAAIQRLAADADPARGIDRDALAEQIRLYRHAARIGRSDTAARDTNLTRKHNALARRMLDRQDNYLRFTTDPAIPADNNGSERDIRMTKLREKISGCMRTLTGARHFCAIRSYLSTAAKHGVRFIDALTQLAEGQAWLPT